ncbi:MAG: FMN-binding protein [Clostridia bacterium]|nr:FMN-binding protein [Clostridia bacterium]
MKFPSKRRFFINVNKKIRKHHKSMGLAMIASALVHGMFSSEPLLSLNLGTAGLVIAILLGLNWIIRKKLAAYKGWVFYHRLLTVLLIMTIAVHVADVGGVQVFNVLKALSVKPEISVSTETGNTYKDGIYTGVAVGFRDGLTVLVEIENNIIISVDVTSHNELNEKYYAPAIEAIPQAILDNQSPDVDAVSGATYTSTGIINAVNNALSQAIIEGDLPIVEEAKPTSGHTGNGLGRGKNP